VRVTGSALGAISRTVAISGLSRADNRAAETVFEFRTVSNLRIRYVKHDVQLGRLSKRHHRLSLSEYCSDVRGDARDNARPVRAQRGVVQLPAFQVKVGRGLLQRGLRGLGRPSAALYRLCA